MVRLLATSSWGIDAANDYNVRVGGGGAYDFLSKVYSALYFTVSVDVHKKAADSIYPMGV